MNWTPSANFGPRRGGVRPHLVVLHYTAMASAEGARDWLRVPQSQVSCHYVISGTGQVWQLVDEALRAWHAGAGQWGSVTDVNSASIGIELANSGAHPFAEPQMAALEALLPGILTRWGIPPSGVIGHSDLAPTRKIDPGPRFDWQRLARGGMALWPDPGLQVALDPGQFWSDLASIGYCADGQKEAVLSAFRARFLPWVSGPVSQQDHVCAARLNLQIRPGPQGGAGA